MGVAFRKLVRLHWPLRQIRSLGELSLSGRLERQIMSSSGPSLNGKRQIKLRAVLARLL
jgi:hypothetical protein